MSQHAGEIAGTHWEPEQYLKFGGQRLRPALELIERVALSSREGGGLIVDLGCGAGNVTRLLRDRWPGARLVAVDNSPEMPTKRLLLLHKLQRYCSPEDKQTQGLTQSRASQGLQLPSNTVS